MLDVYFLLGVGYFVCLCVQQKKRGQKIAIGGRGGGGGRGGAWGVGVWGCGGVVGQKAKKIRAKQKKMHPPYQKNNNFD